MQNTLKHQKIELEITQMTLGGEGLASHQGLKVFVPWTAVGDRILAEVVEEKKDYLRAKMVEILHPSKDRVVPPCPYFLRCGGCQWQHLSAKAQLEAKHLILEDALRRGAKIKAPVLLDPIAAPSAFHYRNRLRLQVSKEGKLGFFRLHSKNLVEIDDCLLVPREISEKFDEAKKYALALARKDPTHLHEIAIIFDPPKAKIEIEPEQVIAFMQTNSVQNETLVARVVEILNLTGTERVLELFAGEGNFTFKIARNAAFVLAVESDETSIIAAEKKTKGRSRIEWKHKTAKRAVEEILSSSKQKHFDRVLIDPPRKGAFEVLEFLPKLKIPEIVYVSCDPSTLARDAQALLMLGYKHQFSQVVDMFPQTYHVESVSFFQKSA